MIIVKKDPVSVAYVPLTITLTEEDYRLFCRLLEGYRGWLARYGQMADYRDQVFADTLYWAVKNTHEGLTPEGKP